MSAVGYVALSPEREAYCRSQLAAHANVKRWWRRAEVCTLCRVSNCTAWKEARITLATAGLIDVPYPYSTDATGTVSAETDEAQPAELAATLRVVRYTTTDCGRWKVAAVSLHQDGNWLTGLAEVMQWMKDRTELGLLVRVELTNLRRQHERPAASTPSRRATAAECAATTEDNLIPGGFGGLTLRRHNPAQPWMGGDKPLGTQELSATRR